MLHLNDSRSLCGSRTDCHEHIGAGNIGSAGLAAVLNSWLGTLPAYLETPGMDDGFDAINLERARMLVRGEALPALPEAAFGARGPSSARAAGRRGRKGWHGLGASPRPSPTSPDRPALLHR